MSSNILLSAADLHDLKADVSINADSLYAAFEKDEATANQLYLDKVIEVYGTIESIKQTDSISNITLGVNGSFMGAVNCSTKERIEVSEGSDIKLKGLCQGFLMDVVLNQCVIVE